MVDHRNHSDTRTGLPAPEQPPGLAWRCPHCGWQYDSPIRIRGVTHHCGGRVRRLVESRQEGH